LLHPSISNRRTKEKEIQQKKGGSSKGKKEKKKKEKGEGGEVAIAWDAARPANPPLELERGGGGALPGQREGVTPHSGKRRTLSLTAGGVLCSPLSREKGGKKIKTPAPCEETCRQRGEK